MVSILNRNLLTELEQGKVGGAALARLVALGREQGYITFDDIVELLPDTEQDVEQLDEAFAALINAGIPYTEEAPEQEQAGHVGEEKEEINDAEAELPPPEEDLLANIDVADTIGLYLKEAARIPLLTANEELELAQRIERGRMAREELARGNVSPHRHNELHQLIRDGWIAREHLITANSRLVISVAKKYIGRGVPFLDLIQEGNIGLMRAAKKFDYHRGYKFSTYATWWIRQAVTRAVADQGRTIRVPVHMGDQISKMQRVQHQLKQKLGRDPTTDEIAVTLDVTSKKVEYMIQVARRPLSLQMPIGDEEEDMLGDFIEDQEAPPPDELATDNLLREHIRDILSRLPPREARILQLRYGLLDGQTLTLNEVGHKMGVTSERVRQIEAQALRRLRSLGLQRELRAYIE
jgi:RNA polymerase primary sigma factor